MMKMFSALFAASPWVPGVCAIFFLGGCAAPKAGRTGKTESLPPRKLPALRTVSRVDLPRYMGDWYVIANIPYFAEAGCIASVETYALRPDGRIDNWFTYRKGSFEAPVKQMRALAWVHNPQTQAEWRVRFFGLITARYLVLDLDPDYRWAVVGHPSRRYGWVLARAKTLPERQYRQILRRLSEQGYDPERFVKVPQQLQ
jgi:apolipoprotein D and lipocalin family protein